MNCDFSEDKSCLNVLDSEASENPKCFCTNLCPISLHELKRNCTSGQMFPDECGTCLVCAKSRGEECGGLRNKIGICSAGLKCLVRFSIPRNSDGRQEENEAVGTCVSEDSSLCPGPDVLSLDDGVNCRPGRLGIIADAFYCPLIDRQKNAGAEDVTKAATTTTMIITTTATTPGLIDKPFNRPTLIELILSNVPR